MQRLAVRIESDLLSYPAIDRHNMDLVPATLEMTRQENEGQVLQEGDKLTVTCMASGAKPEAKIYWNSEPPLNMNDTSETYVRESNGWTFNTTNRLTFRAQRQLTSLSCFAYNKVLSKSKGAHLKKATVINVRYKPHIERRP